MSNNLCARSSAPQQPNETLRPPHLQRAIGVINRPETERWSHDFHANVTEQLDALIHFDETHARQPLEPHAKWESGELPETFPSGIKSPIVRRRG